MWNSASESKIDQKQKDSDQTLISDTTFPLPELFWIGFRHSNQ